ncbi:hypothetical protein BJI69_17950 [Luteibacter rhizovicinus DSM 16549]|uniref:Uncharacterized protein n=2 Tax=Luteibacter rhizovicinus TaxID=242606 RepID=A0A1L3EX57_9GAMM|nr:hypothetical protein BJI69_17950 [Luteibacter rhizovicinus DSM 16549]
MAWEAKVNRELGHLNDAHSAARIDTPEYRQRRRALLQSALLSEGSGSHTLRRPAGGMATAVSATTIRAMPMRRAVTRTSQTHAKGLRWWLGGGVLVLLAAAVLTWSVLR